MTTAEQVEGVVERTNDTGIFVAGDWRNFSRFKTVERPSRGDHVRLELDPKGFINRVEVLEAAAARASSPFAGDRSQTITRLAVLKAAAAFAASREGVKSADVLAIADRWLEWVQQPLSSAPE